MSLSCCHRQELLPFHILRLILQLREYASVSILHLQKAQSKGQEDWSVYSTQWKAWREESLLSKSRHTGLWTGRIGLVTGPHWHSLWALGPTTSSVARAGIFAVCFMAWCRHVLRSSLGCEKGSYSHSQFSGQQDFCCLVSLACCRLFPWKLLFLNSNPNTPQKAHTSWANILSSCQEKTKERRVKTAMLLHLRQGSAPLSSGELLQYILARICAKIFQLIFAKFNHNSRDSTLP